LCTIQEALQQAEGPSHDTSGLAAVLDEPYYSVMLQGVSKDANERRYRRYDTEYMKVGEGMDAHVSCNMSPSDERDLQIIMCAAPACPLRCCVCMHTAALPCLVLCRSMTLTALLQRQALMWQSPQQNATQQPSTTCKAKKWKDANIWVLGNISSNR
jgi:hypothetical protein